MPPAPVITPLIEKMARRDVISPIEREALAGLLGPTRRVAAGKALVEPGDRPDFSTFVVSGFCARFTLTPTGGRQLTEINIGGDFVDLHSLLMRQMDHGVVALADCVVAPAAHEDLRRLSEQQPHLMRLLWLETVVDAAIHRQWLVALGQQNAASRLAHLICELYLRLEAAGIARNFGFVLPMTQVDLGDVLGLTQVHVNRVLMDLRRQGLVDWKAGHMTINDWESLARLGQFDPAYLRLQNDPV
ncbi:Crp/Fnr family transcriptional regulator [Caulobacter sp. D4A]|nr:Crp/Fnr family transcriptional regulator [Caulobacter sp. D5]PXA95489.1 Crp/Fnr family transcriptional regulator [Caulobacter sp. D4A]